jgi:hypothetical protein
MVENAIPIMIITVDYHAFDLCGKPVKIRGTDVRGRWADHYTIQR